MLVLLVHPPSLASHRSHDHGRHFLSTVHREQSDFLSVVSRRRSNRVDDQKWAWPTQHKDSVSSSLMANFSVALRRRWWLDSAGHVQIKNKVNSFIGATRREAENLTSKFSFDACEHQQS